METSTPSKRRKVTVKHLLEMKANRELIVGLGVYDAPMARIADALGFELLMNGNAGPMSLLGHKTPTTVTFEEQLMLTKAISRMEPRAMNIAHLPYGTYLESKEQAVRSAVRMVAEGGADGVKVEGNSHIADHIAHVVRAGIPVIAHIGLQPSRHERGGWGVKGRSAKEAAEIVADARALVDAGVFAFLVELAATELTQYLSESLPVPVLSAGGGGKADGISIISGDAIGYSAFPRPKHEGQFVNVTPIIEEGLSRYRMQARSGEYPSKEHIHHMPADEHSRFLELVQPR